MHIKVYNIDIEMYKIYTVSAQLFFILFYLYLSNIRCELNADVLQKLLEYVPDKDVFSLLEASPRLSRSPAVSAWILKYFRNYLKVEDDEILDEMFLVNLRYLFTNRCT